MPERKLSDQQRSRLRRTDSGKTQGQIAGEDGVSERSVKRSVAGAKGQLDLPEGATAKEAADAAKKRGLID